MCEKNANSDTVHSMWYTCTMVWQTPTVCHYTVSVVQYYSIVQYSIIQYTTESSTTVQSLCQFSVDGKD